MTLLSWGFPMTRRRVTAVLSAVVTAAALALVGAPAQAAVGDVVNVSGTIVDDSGQPVVGQWVSLMGQGFSMYSGTTDQDGHYSIDFVMQGDVESVTVVGINRATCDPIPPLTGPGSITVNCVVALVHQLTVSGVATTDDGTPVGGSYPFVNVYDAAGLARAWGFAPINPDGTYTLTVNYLGGVDQINITAPNGSVVRTLTGFADGDVITGVDFTYHPLPEWYPFPFTLHGKVTDKKGKPISGATVEFGYGPGNYPDSTVTGADGTYVLNAQTYWNDEYQDGTDAFLTINGQLVDYVENVAPDADITFDYRVGKTPAFELFADDVVVDEQYNYAVDVWRKINKDGSGEFAVCDASLCTGANFGGKHTTLLGVSPIVDPVGSRYLLFQDTTGGISSWLRVMPDLQIADKATFAPGKVDGFEWFDYRDEPATDLVVWLSKGGQTELWTWPGYGPNAEVEHQQVDGKLVTIDHRDLDAQVGEEVVLVTRQGKNYTVSLLASPSAAPEVVSTGKGEPTVTYTDADGDQVFDIVVTYPDHTKHKHHCAH